MANEPNRMPPVAAILLETARPGVFLRTVLGLLASFAVLCVALLLYIQRRGELPPPPITDDISFNEKAQLLRSMPKENVSIIAAGSSLALNDLSSEAFLARFPAHPTLINIAAWGMRISETRLWLGHVIKKLGNPHVVLMCISPEDFETEFGWYARADSHLDDYLDGKLRSPFIIGNFSLVNYMKLSRHMKEYRTSRLSYASLKFDRDGGVPLDIRQPYVDAARWNYVTVYDKIDERQYNELNQLAAELRSNGILLICVRPPRRGATVIEENIIQAENYQSRIAGILQKNNQIMLNLPPDLALDDSNFADSIHLNAQGARAFSEFLGSAVASMPPWSANSVPPK